MRQIRARVREKRGVDYTEAQIQEIASATLERYLDPDKIRSGLLDEFKRLSAAPSAEFEEQALFGSHRWPIRLIRRALRPILKLFMNPDKLVQATRFSQHVALSYEVLHNLVVELTRLGIEVKNLKMRVESLSSRLDFDERRARALEGMVQYRPGALAPPAPAAAAGSGRPAEGAREPEGTAAEGRKGRRRRRRGRRGGSQGLQPGDARETSGSAPEMAVSTMPQAGEPPAHPPRDPGASDDPGSSDPNQ